MPPHKRDIESKDQPVAEAGTADGRKSSVGSKISGFLKSGLKSGKRELIQAQKDLKHTVGLGHRPNVVPEGTPDINSDERPIELGWHPVGGATGKWFAEKTMIGQAITQKIGKYPDPTQHWALLVGGYVHQLWMDESLNVIYINEELKRDEWHTFEVGKTKFNDQALRKAGQMTIHNMRTKRPAYNLISNNCQNFAVNMLDSVQVGGHKEFATAFSVYQRATGDGDVLTLWSDKPAAEQQQLDGDEEKQDKAKRQDTVKKAEQVMQENTTEIDHHDGTE